MRNMQPTPPRWIPVCVLAASLTLNAVLPAAPASAAEEAENRIERDCFWQLTEGRADTIDCDFPVRMTPIELKKVRELTRGVLIDAHCNMVVSIARRLVTEAIDTPDHIFEPPPQPVNCTIETTKRAFPIAFSFRPRVIFKDGRAIEATPGMAAPTRATRVLSWPVRKWVNTSDEIEDAMIRIINAYLKRYRK